MAKPFTKIIALIFNLLIGILSYSQTPAILKSDNKEIKELGEVESNGWIRFKESLSVKPNEVFSNKKAFGLSTKDEMKLVKTIKDNHFKDREIYKYRQFYKGLEVEGADYTISTRQGKPIFSFGKIAENITLSTIPKLSEKEALEIALKTISAKKYTWEDVEREKEIKTNLKDSNSTYYPKGQLLLAKHSGKNEIVSTNYSLSYKFEIYTESPIGSFKIYIDAITGKVLKNIDKLNSGTCTTLYNGHQNFNIRYRSLPHWDYVLEDEGKGIVTKYYKEIFGVSVGFETLSHIDHKGGDWGTADQNATSAHWAAQKAWDYLNNTFGYSGTDYWIHIRTNLPEVNAYHRDLPTICELTFGHGLNGNSFACLDVVGHELFHNVTSNMNGLEYEGESGALNESFSDIFAFMTELSVEGNNADWTIGEDTDRSLSRNMADPSLTRPRPQPSFYEGAWWHATNPCTDPFDNCGVHRNSGVQNHWFFLLANRIGADRAARIAHRNQANYLNPHSNYMDSRNGSIQAAIDLYGVCSNEHLQTRNTWADVGVGDRMAACLPPLRTNLFGPVSLDEDEYGTWYAHSTGGDGNYSYTWYADYGWGWVTLTDGDTYSTYMERTPFTLMVEVISAGLTATSERYIVCSCGGAQMRANVYPNPAQESVNVKVELKKEAFQNGEILPSTNEIQFEYLLYNNFGNIVYKSIGYKFHAINTDNLKSGIYQLHIVSPTYGVAKQTVNIKKD